MTWLMKLGAGLLAVAMMVGAAAAQDKAIIVLDGSGSMWGQIEGKPKLEIARETLTEVLAGVPETLELGLMAYGHREKGNCGDIELIVPPGAATGPAISQAANGMRFLGKTPLSAAVQQAAEALRYTENKATVILITDGIETCEADPCALGLGLEESGVDFTAHVVGFGLSREEGRSVACLAENTGGKFVLAEDAGELGEALGDAVAAASAEAPEVAAAPAAPVELPPATVSAAGPVAIGSAFAVSWTGPGGKDDYVTIISPEAPEPVPELSYAYVAADKDAVLQAPGVPGTYTLRYRWRGPDSHYTLAEATVEVVEAPATIVGPAKVSVGQSFQVTWKGPGEEGDYIDVVPEGYAETSGELDYAYVRDGATLGLQAPGNPGSYQLRYVLQAAGGREVLISVPLEVEAATATLAFPPSAEVGSEIAVYWTGPAADGDYVDLVPAGYSALSGEITYAYLTRGDEVATMTAPSTPGSYEIRYVLQAGDGRQMLASQPLEVTETSVSLDAPAEAAAGSTLTVGWTGPSGRRNYVDLVPADATEAGGELDYFYTRTPGGGEGELRVPETPGAYAVRFVLDAPGGARVVTSVPLTVK